MTKPTFEKPRNVEKEKMLHTIMKRIISRSKHRLQLSSTRSLPRKIFLLPIENKSVNDLLNDTNYFQSLNVISSNSLITFFQQPEYLDKILNNHIYMYTENIFDFIDKYVLPYLCCIKYSYKDDISWFLSLFHCTPLKALVYNLISSPVFVSQQISLMPPITNTTSSILIKNTSVEVIRHIPLDVIKCYDISSVFLRQVHDLLILTSNLKERQLLDIQNISIYLNDCKDTLTQYVNVINIKATFPRDKIDKYISSANKNDICYDTNYTAFCDEKLKHILYPL